MDIIEQLINDSIKHDEEQIDFITKTIGKEILDININKIFEVKLNALIEEQKDDVDEHGIMRIMIDEDMIDWLLFHFKTCSEINVINKCYYIVKIEISNLDEHFVYLKDLNTNNEKKGE